MRAVGTAALPRHLVAPNVVTRASLSLEEGGCRLASFTFAITSRFSQRSRSSRRARLAVRDLPIANQKRVLGSVRAEPPRGTVALSVAASAHVLWP